jgi:hypothetical protein
MADDEKKEEGLPTAAPEAMPPVAEPEPIAVPTPAEATIIPDPLKGMLTAAPAETGKEDAPTADKEAPQIETKVVNIYKSDPNDISKYGHCEAMRIAREKNKKS